MDDVLIIGAGPAGISAALYARRANLEVQVLYHGKGNLQKAHKIDNYYGFPSGISGEELFKNGIEQAKNLGVKILDTEATHIDIEDNMTFSVQTDKGKFSSKTLILATGNKKFRPAIKGIEELDGKGVSYCAVCDAFFYRQKDVAVLGNGKFALSEAEVLNGIASSIKILTNGEDASLLEENTDKKYSIETKKIASLEADENSGKLKNIIFADKSNMRVDGLFIALGEAGASDFAKKLGLAMNEDNIVVNNKMETNIEGLYSCGNSTGGLFQVSKAAYEGTLAGLSASEYVKGISKKN